MKSALVVVLATAGLGGLSAGVAGCKKRDKGNAAEARDVLEAFVKPGADRAALFVALQPKPKDYETVFVEDAALKAKAAMDPLWETTKGFEPTSDQTQVEVTGVTVEELAKGGEEAADCPAGYKGIADKLKPGIMVYCFRFVKPGDKGGLAGDALVKIDDHWAYFPKAFRYLK